MKKKLTANHKITKDAKETVQEHVSEFINFITSEYDGERRGNREKRKTINEDDLIWEMAILGFEDYIDALKLYLSRYREMEGLILAIVASLIQICLGSIEIGAFCFCPN
ncbi:nuclear transcription factor Y subunit B-like [Impatiens glandulifera]|uniref:nuclear transcription factor Y subunit B-like n=1 Tax=Impatiens glandulifera TaxID=253017 RepID=UPI001FB06BC5|nr:nuclear transcription factor Y subunit B-like [Impatiens glandulifera]